MKTVFLALILFNSFTLTAEETKSNLFYIERNKNRNQVHYELTLMNDCKIKADSLHGYWRDLEEGPNVTSEITMFQQPAYGIKSQKIEGAEMHFQLKAVGDVNFRAIPKKNGEGCLVTSLVQLDNRWHQVQKIYVFAEEGFVMPTVKYIEYHLLGENNQVSKKRVNIN